MGCQPTGCVRSSIAMDRQLKTLVRELDARSLEATWQGIGQLLAVFTASKRANYLTNAGYASA